jgi:UDPglucose 6-dehydrogenase
MEEAGGNRPLRLTVLGAGYLGITHSACMASLGFEVLGVDIDAGKVDQLNAGQLPIYEPGLRELLRSGLDSGRLAFTTSYRRAAAFGDVHFICAGTPPQPGSHHADLSQVNGCISALAPLLDRLCLVVGKSTVPVGTARRLAAELTRACPEAELAWNPEFLREGSAVADSLSPDRIVAGVTSSWAEGLLRRVYARPIANGSLFVTTGLETAELAKVAANAFLATKVSFINAMAEICEAAGGDVQVLSQILGADSRIGPSFLRPGLGFGGGCLPKDIRAFIARAADLDAGQALGFLREVDAINLRRRIRTADLACEMVGGDLTDVPVCVLGAAFKPGSDDVRDSPALDVAQILHGMGAQVTVYDPAALGNARRARPELGYAETLAEAAQNAHIVLLLTEWAEFAGLKPADLETVVAQRNIVDGRSILAPDVWHTAGWNYQALGVAIPPPLSTRPLRSSKELRSHRQRHRYVWPGKSAPIA